MGLSISPSGGVSVATTAAVLYVDSLGSDSSGARGNPNKPFLTGNAAYAAASDGDTILFGKGAFSVTTANAIKNVVWAGINVQSTALTLTSTNTDALWQSFYRMSVTVHYSHASALTFNGCSIAQSTCTIVLDAPTIDLGGDRILMDTLSYVLLSTGASVTSVDGGITLSGGYADNVVILTHAEPTAEVYLINGGGAVSIKNASDVVTGAVNAQNCYGLDLQAATIRITNSAYANLQGYTTLVDGGGNRDETVDIEAVQTFGRYTLATLPTVPPSGIITVSDATGGQTLCFSNGTNWISVKTGVAVA